MAPSGVQPTWRRAATKSAEPGCGGVSRFIAWPTCASAAARQTNSPGFADRRDDVLSLRRATAAGSSSGERRTSACGSRRLTWCPARSHFVFPLAAPCSRSHESDATYLGHCKPPASRELSNIRKRCTPGSRASPSTGRFDEQGSTVTKPSPATTSPPRAGSRNFRRRRARMLLAEGAVAGENEWKDLAPREAW